MSDEAAAEATPSSEPSPEKRGPGRPSKAEAQVAELRTELAAANAAHDKQIAEMKALVAQMAAMQTPIPQHEEVPVEQEPVPWGEDGRYTYSCSSKDCTIIWKRDMKLVVNGEVVFQPARTITFQEGWYVTEDPEARDFIESLPEFKTGQPYRIARGAELRPVPTRVTEGVRTSHREVPMRTVPRPAGVLSAPLN